MKETMMESRVLKKCDHEEKKQRRNNHDRHRSEIPLAEPLTDLLKIVP